MKFDKIITNVTKLSLLSKLHSNIYMKELAGTFLTILLAYSGYYKYKKQYD